MNHAISHDLRTMSRKIRQNYTSPQSDPPEFQQGSLWDDKTTKAIQQQTAQSKLRHSLAESGGTYRLVMGANGLAQWKEGILKYQLRVRERIKQRRIQRELDSTTQGASVPQGFCVEWLEKGDLANDFLEGEIPIEECELKRNSPQHTEIQNLDLLDLFGNESPASYLGSNSDTQALYDPFDLPVYPTEFYRLPSQGGSSLGADDACIYFVLDQAAQLLLYIGETCRSQKRWQGIHDCKRYIQNYQALHYQHQKPTAVVMAFAWDVPQESPSRRNLEQNLIQLWRSPFNRESWQYWQTPFV